MKNIFYILTAIALFFDFQNLPSQILQIYETDASNYPYMKTGFRVFKTDGTEIRNEGVNRPIEKREIEIKEFIDGQGLERMIPYDPTCGDTTKRTFSAILVVDNSGSMEDEVSKGGQTKADIVKDVLKDWIKSFDPERTECAIVAFAGRPFDKNGQYDPRFPICPFTNDRNVLKTAINNLPTPSGGTNYNAAFLHDPDRKTTKNLSALYYCQNNIAKYRPVIIFLTDGVHEGNESFDLDEVIKLARQRNALIYVIKFGNQILLDNQKKVLETLSLEKDPEDKTPNIWYDITDAGELLGIYNLILDEAGKYGYAPPCYVEWVAGCQPTDSATLTLKKYGLTAKINYTVDQNKLPRLEIIPSNYIFENVVPGETERVKIRLTSRNNFSRIESVSISDTVKSTGRYSINWKGVTPVFEIPKDSTIEIEIVYTPTDSSCSAITYHFEGFVCVPPWTLKLGGLILPHVETIDMGNVNIGETKSQIFTQVFCNKTCSEIKIQDIKLNKGNKDNFQILNYEPKERIMPGECLRVEFSFTPKEPSGTKTSDIEVFTDYNATPVFKGKIIGNSIGKKTLTYINDGFEIVDCEKLIVKNAVALVNSGNVKINIDSCKIFTDEINFEIENGIYPKLINGAGQENINILFHPFELRNLDYTGELWVWSDAENSSVKIVLTGAMDNYDFELADTINFGKVCVGEINKLKIPIQNIGNTDINLKVVGDAKFIPEFNDYLIPKSQNTEIIVDCILTNPGFNISELTIKDIKCGNEKKVTLIVKGIKPVISIDKEISLTGYTGNPGELEIYVTNITDDTVDVNTVEPLENDRFSILEITPNLPKALKPGDAIKIKIAYEPNIGDLEIIESGLRITGTICNFDTVVKMIGNPGLATVEINLSDTSGFDKQIIKMPLYLNNGFKFDECGITNIEVQIKFNSDLLIGDARFPISDAPEPKFKIITIPGINVKKQNEYQILQNVEFIVERKNPALTNSILEITAKNNDGGGLFIYNHGSFSFLPTLGKLTIEDENARPGDTGFDMKLKLSGEKNLDAKFHESMFVKLRFNCTLLEPKFGTPLFNFETKEWTVDLEIPLSTFLQTKSLELPFNTMLGNAECTQVIIDDVWLKSGKGNFTKEDGKFCLLALCKEGDNDQLRLFNPFPKLKLLSLNPNPSDGKVRVEYETSEKGITKIWVSDILGNKVLELVDGIIERGTDEISFDGIKMEAGVYFIIMETPTQVVREKMYIVR